MWESLVFRKSQINKINLEYLFSGKCSSLVIQSFYDKDTCQTIANRIRRYRSKNPHNKELRHIGPFLMSYVTKKGRYFEDSKESLKIFDGIFSGIKTPTAAIRECISKILPNHMMSVATEDNNMYSPFIIRIYEKGRSIPIHKDNVGYEGREYSISNVDTQLSCVLHLQESESGGDLVMYDKQWTKEDEKLRNVDFGYSSHLTKLSNYSVVSNIRAGDLVIINPKYYHKVTKITGSTPRITLGMFLGLYRKDCKIVMWA